MTCGHFTLPAVILIGLIVWVVTFDLQPALAQEQNSYLLWQWIGELGIPAWLSRALSFALYAIIGYFLIEINNTFAIIRMRASVQTSFYFLLITICLSLHQLCPGNIAALTFLFALFFLFKSYQQIKPASYLFHSFTFIGLGSLAFPQMTFLVPLWLIGAWNFQSLTFRSLCAAVMGWMLPYWMLLGYAVVNEQMNVFVAPFIELSTFQPIHHWADLPTWVLVTLGFLLIEFIVSAAHYLITGNEDKIRTRSYLNFLILVGSGIFLFIFLQPAHSLPLVSLLLIVISILMGHLFILANNRLSNGFFISTLLAFIFLLGFNLWILL